MINKFKIIIFLILSLLILIFHYDNKELRLKILNLENNDKYDYHKNCISLFKKLRYPNESLIYKPPLKIPPEDLLNEFTQNGEMPITRYWYFNETYSDSSSNNKSIKEIIKMEDFHFWTNRVRKNEKLHYDNINLQRIMSKYSKKIRNKTMLIIGTIIPWVEAISYELFASKITTLEYTRKKYDLSLSNRLKWFHVNDYLDDLILNDKIELFDNSVSFSSIEHSGLGRYGDPLSPNGDIEAVQKIHCLLKPNSLFFLGLPTSKNGKSYIEFNAHRVYGVKRLNKLFVGWKIIDKIRSFNHMIYVLKKIKI
jgi:hypothetical protein